MKDRINAMFVLLIACVAATLEAMTYRPAEFAAKKVHGVFSTERTITVVTPDGTVKEVPMGQAGMAGVLQGILTVGAGAVAIIILVYVFASIETNIPDTGCTTADENIDSVADSAYGAFGLSGTLLYAVIGGVAIAVILRMFVLR